MTIEGNGAHAAPAPPPSRPPSVPVPGARAFDNHRRSGAGISAQEETRAGASEDDRREWKFRRTRAAPIRRQGRPKRSLPLWLRQKIQKMPRSRRLDPSPEHAFCFVSGHDFSRAATRPNCKICTRLEWKSEQGLKSLRSNSRIWEARRAHRRSLRYAPVGMTIHLGNDT